MTPKAVLVVSGKGGTGKTIVSINLAYELSKRGKIVGLIDGDVSNPNLPNLMGVSQELETTRETIKPLTVNGIQMVSMGLIAGDKAICMDSSQYAEFLRDLVGYSEWKAIDYFIVDLPASNSDEFKKMVRVFSDNLIGSVIVMQPAHSIDAERVIKLHLDNGIPVVGLVENMSFFQAGKVKYKIFGESTVEAISKEFNIPVLGQIPLTMGVRKAVQEQGARLDGELAEPILKAVDHILEMKVQKPGFLEKIKAKATELIETTLIQMVLAANKEIDIRGIQGQFGYPGGRVIRFNLMDDSMERILVSADFKILDGKLVAVENPRQIDTGIDLKSRALAWAMLGNKVLAGGGLYDLEIAWYMGDARVWGYGDTIRGVHFMKEVWNTMRNNRGAMEKLAPLLQRLA